jgi:alkylation response protein AidB-like acyl-CoA dehydrogenase
MANPLIHDRTIDFLLYEVLDAETTLDLPAFEGHGRETYDLFIGNARRIAREILLPTYRAMDAEAPSLVDGTVKLHPLFHVLWPHLVELGIIAATRPPEVGGAQLPITIAAAANAYLAAGNGAPSAAAGLTTSAARLIESFGTEALREKYLAAMYEGRFTGTMCLTEPQAGSSLADVATRATPTADGHYLVRGSKVFISGGDQDLTENIIHLVLARIDGAPAGIKGLSLFAVPRFREENGVKVANDTTTSGVFHKIGWRALPSIALEFGDRGDCHGYLVGEANRGIAHMFQMMNEARLMVGMSAVATASVAYQESLAYARDRPQGRPLAGKDPKAPQVSIVAHADVRRMLLRQKAIVEGGFALLFTASLAADLAEHAVDAEARARASRRLDLLIPIAKTFPSEYGFEANVLSVQIHGGYGYTSEYTPEAYMRDQKLNSIHEGTTGIQGIDLLGRKVLGDGGKALNELGRDITDDIARAREAGVSGALCDALASALARTGGLALKLGVSMSRVGAEAVLAQASHFMQLASILVVSWQWLVMATAAERGRVSRPADATFYEGKLAAARYFIETELSRVDALAVLCEDPSPAFLEVSPDALD